MNMFKYLLTNRPVSIKLFLNLFNFDEADQKIRSYENPNP